MNFNQLRYILSVEKYRNFAKAADDCDVAQSTLSKEIQRLEREFNIMIFDRSKHPVVPTMKGIDLIESAQKITREQQHFIEIAQKRDNQPSGKFHLGILPGLAPYLLPLFTTSLAKKYPKLNLKVFEIGEKEMEDLFHEDQLDASLTIEPFSQQGFYEDFLFNEKFVLYLNDKHPLAKKQIVNWEEIPIEELILQKGIQSFLLDKEEQAELPLSTSNIQTVAYENGSLETIRKIIDLNGGITLLPQLATLYMGERRLKQVRQIQSPALSRDIILVTPRGFEKNRITKVLKKEILHRLPNQLP